MDIVSLAAAFRRVADQASGHVAPGHESRGPEEGASSSSVRTDEVYGPWRPFLADVLANERITSADHFQDTRLVLQGPGSLASMRCVCLHWRGTATLNLLMLLHSQAHCAVALWFWSRNGEL